MKNNISKLLHLCVSTCDQAISRELADSYCSCGEIFCYNNHNAAKSHCKELEPNVDCLHVKISKEI